MSVGDALSLAAFAVCLRDGSPVWGAVEVGSGQSPLTLRSEVHFFLLLENPDGNVPQITNYRNTDHFIDVAEIVIPKKYQAPLLKTLPRTQSAGRIKCIRSVGGSSFWNCPPEAAAPVHAGAFRPYIAGCGGPIL